MQYRYELWLDGKMLPKTYKFIGHAEKAFKKMPAHATIVMYVNDKFIERHERDAYHQDFESWRIEGESCTHRFDMAGYCLRCGSVQPSRPPVR